MIDIYAYLVDMPDCVREAVTPCEDGYTVYIDDKLSREGQIRAYKHALEHIYNMDFEKLDIQSIESQAHKEY